jgi:hypothetical protein
MTSIIVHMTSLENKHCRIGAKQKVLIRKEDDDDDDDDVGGHVSSCDPCMKNQTC